jgi:hypothetical protein
MSGKHSKHSRRGTASSFSGRGRRGSDGHKARTHDISELKTQSQDPVFAAERNPLVMSDGLPLLPAQITVPATGKMLLPPLHHNLAKFNTSKREKSRTSHACQRCRKSKSKCSGVMPCEKCISEDKECVYSDGKRDKEKKYVFSG